PLLHLRNHLFLDFASSYQTWIELHVAHGASPVGKEVEIRRVDERPPVLKGTDENRFIRRGILGNELERFGVAGIDPLVPCETAVSRAPVQSGVDLTTNVKVLHHWKRQQRRGSQHPTEATGERT